MGIEKLILSRRIFLKGQLGGLATLMGLPFLESLFNNKAYAQALGQKALRFAVFYHPNGVIQERVGNALEGFAYFPDRTSNTVFDLANSNMQAIGSMNLREYLTIVRGVRTPNGSGNAHMRGISGFLSGRGIANDAVRSVSISLDNFLVNRIAQGRQTSSLYLVGNPQLDPPNNNNYNNSLKNALSFDANGGLRVPQNDYLNIFNQLFAGVNQQAAQVEIDRRAALRLSVLDSVKEAREMIDSKVNTGDKAKLDEYYTRIFELERKVANVGGPAAPGAIACVANRNNLVNLQNYSSNQAANNVIHDLDSITDNMSEMMAIAFACDRLRVFTYMFGGEAAGCEYRNLNVNKHFHNTLSHNTNQSNAVAGEHRVVDRYHIHKIAQFANKLKLIDEGNGQNALDNTVILSGSGLARGYNHTHDPLPIMMLGKGGGGIRGGQFLEVTGDDKPTGVLLASIVQAMGLGAQAIGDNTGARTFNLG